MTNIDDRTLRKFAREAQEKGIKTKSAFVKWFRTVKKQSAAMDRLHKAWKLSESDIHTPLNPAIQKNGLLVEAITGLKDENLYLSVNPDEFEILNRYLSDYRNGSFYLLRNENISKVMNENDVTDQSGIYIISAIKDDSKKIIYIGKAGSMTTNGTLKSQGIKGRLKNVGTKNVSRNIIFQQVIKENNYDKLEFIWIVTFDEVHKQLPAYIEAKLLQTYYEKVGVLPHLNKSI